MSRRATVELFEEIRREYHHGCGTIKGVADKLGVHRRMVRQALASPVPPPPKERNRTKPVLSELEPFIDGILEADLRAPRKQRHTAHRIWTRAREELGSSVSESTVYKYVRSRKQELELERRETFIPQCYQPGQEGQVDWYEAHVDFRAASGERDRVKAQIFAMRAMFSGAAFHMAFPHATQQAFLEAHESAFSYFGGVFHTLRYDNLGSAVKKILRGYQREETQRFIAFRSHWGFASQFCNPAKGHEKGGVEGELGYFRRNHLVPVPQIDSWEQLNQILVGACVTNGQRRIGDRRERVDTLWDLERVHIRPLATEGFDLSEVLWPRVDSKGCVCVKTNHYSTPLRPGGQPRVVVSASRVEVWHNNRLVAAHVRRYERHQRILELEHYLDVLDRKPGALENSIPLAQARAQGRWPASFDVLWQRLQERHGRMRGTAQLIDLLLLASGRFGENKQSVPKAPGWDALRQAVEQALQLGTVDIEAIRLLLLQRSGETDSPAGTDGSRPAPLRNQGLTAIQLAHYERPLPDMGCYDRLRPVSQGPEPSSEPTAKPVLRLVSRNQQEAA